MLKKKLLVSAIAGLCSLPALAADSFIYDGHYVEEEYDIAFAIDYDLGDGKTATGGTLAFSSFGGKQYMYIAHPLGFKDLSYAEGSNSKDSCDKTCENEAKAAEKAAKTDYEDSNGTCGKDKACKSARDAAGKAAKQSVIDSYSHAASEADDYLVGWEGSEQKDAGNAIGSEYFTLSFDDGTGVNTFVFDPEVLEDKDRKNGVGTSKDADNIDIVYDAGEGTYTPQAVVVNGLGISFLSTLNYNASLLNAGDFYGDLGDFYDKSPETVDCGDESSSADVCYKLADTTRNNIFTPEKTWDFDFGIEVEITGNLFGAGFDIRSLLPANFGVKNAGATVNNQRILVSLDDLHASKPKVPCVGEGINGNNTPCDVTITEKPPKEKPEPVSAPSALSILGIGIVAMWHRRRKSA
jgi:hypothetical protein